MEEKLIKLIKSLAFFTFLMPLIILPANFIFPFIVPKILFFRSMILLMLGVYFILLASNWQKYKIQMTWMNIAVILFFISFSLSTFIGVDWYKSFWDNHERMLGMFTIAHYIIYYYVCTSVIKEWRSWRWLLRLFLLAGSIVMLIGIWQKFINPEAVLNKGGERVSATLGNPIYYSGYGLFLTFLGYLLFWKEKNKIWKWIAAVGSLLGFLGIFLGATRGTLLGFFSGLALLLVSYVILLKRNEKAKKILSTLVASGFIIFLLLFTLRSTPFVSNIPLLGTVLNINISSGTAHTRVMAWGIAVDAWKEKPVFGWGPNNYYYAYNRFYRPEFLEYGWGETWFDNAHSSVMNTLAVQGFLGLLFYIGLFAVPAFALWVAQKKGTISDPHLVASSIGFLVAHFVHNAFVFENPTSYLYFFFFLAFLNSHLSNSQDTQETREESNKKISIGLSSVVMVIVLLLIYSTNINPARANMATLETIRLITIGSPDFIDEYQIASTVPSPHIDDIRNDFARSVNPLISNFIKNAPKEEDKEQIKGLLKLAQEELEKNMKLHPLDIRVHIQLIPLKQMEAQIEQKTTHLVEAEEIMADALSKSPKRQQLQYTMSGLKLQLNKSQEAIDILKESIDNDPKIAEGWLRLALTYNQLGNVDLAKKTVEEASEHGIEFTGQAAQTINQIIDQTEE